jgi:hypothetical protein
MYHIIQGAGIWQGKKERHRQGRKQEGKALVKPGAKQPA